MDVELGSSCAAVQSLTDRVCVPRLKAALLESPGLIWVLDVRDSRYAIYSLLLPYLWAYRHICAYIFLQALLKKCLQSTTPPGEVHCALLPYFFLHDTRVRPDFRSGDFCSTRKISKTLWRCAEGLKKFMENCFSPIFPMYLENNCHPVENTRVEIWFGIHGLTDSWQKIDQSVWKR